MGVTGGKGHAQNHRKTTMNTQSSLTLNNERQHPTRPTTTWETFKEKAAIQPASEHAHQAKQVSEKIVIYNPQVIHQSIRKAETRLRREAQAVVGSGAVGREERAGCLPVDVAISSQHQITPRRNVAARSVLENS